MLSHPFSTSSGNDVIVFIHIPKTGGSTFGAHLVTNLDVKFRCKCRNGLTVHGCPCLNQFGKEWLFSRYSLGWPCGVHAGWTELYHRNCVGRVLDRREHETRSRRYNYTCFTLFLSRHVMACYHRRSTVAWLTGLFSDCGSDSWWETKPKREGALYGHRLSCITSHFEG